MMTPSIVSNAAIVRKIYFPREVLPLSSALVGLVDFAVSLATLFLLMAYYGVFPAASAIYVLLVILIELVFVTGIGLFAAAICAFQRDILFVAVFVLQLWMFLSPVLYPLSSVPPDYRTLYLVNPMASIMTLFRDAMFGLNPIDLRLLGIAALEAVITLCFGYGVFKSAEKYFADAV
jgi:lipopolysaccharide transport system permease protein